MIAGVCGIAATFVAALLAKARTRRRRRECILHLAVRLTVSREPTGDWDDTLVMSPEVGNIRNAAVGSGSVRWTASALSPWDDDTFEVMKHEYHARSKHHANLEFP